METYSKLGQKTIGLQLVVWPMICLWAFGQIMPGMNLLARVLLTAVVTTVFYFVLFTGRQKQHEAETEARKNLFANMGMQWSPEYEGRGEKST